MNGYSWKRLNLCAGKSGGELEHYPPSKMPFWGELLTGSRSWTCGGCFLMTQQVRRLWPRWSVGGKEGAKKGPWARERIPWSDQRVWKEKLSMHLPALSLCFIFRSYASLRRWHIAFLCYKFSQEQVPSLERSYDCQMPNATRLVKVSHSGSQRAGRGNIHQYQLYQ